MSPDLVIEAYVNDVAARLPQAKRNDVALELKALLGEELAGKAAAAGRPADEAMTLELVRGFGSPEDVAEGYRAPGFTIIAPTRTDQFIALALGGVGLQWLGTLPRALQRAFEPGREFVSVGSWWLSSGLGALWWPGFMVIAAIISAWLRHTWPAEAGSTWRPRAATSDVIHRPLWALGAVAALCGIGVMFAMPWILAHMLPAVTASAFALSQNFLPVGGAVVALLWAANAVLFAVVYSEGRWRPLTRHLDIALNSVWCVTLLWFVLAARIFVADHTDQVTKSVLVLVVLIALIDLAVKIYRMTRRPHAREAAAAMAKR